MFAPASPADRAASADFVGRVAQLDPAAVVRLVGADSDVPGAVDLWAKGGFGVLATCRVAGRIDPDPLTVYATNLVAALAVSRESEIDAGGPADWFTQLPPAGGWTDAGELPVAEIVDQVRRAKEVAERAVEIERVDELRAKTKATVPPAVLDQVLLTVVGGRGRVPISMRMLFAFSGMGFAVPESGTSVRVRTTATWLRLDAPGGSVARRRMADLPLN